MRESECVCKERGDAETERGTVIFAVQPTQNEQRATECVGEKEKGAENEIAAALRSRIQTHIELMATLFTDLSRGCNVEFWLAPMAVRESSLLV